MKIITNRLASQQNKTALKAYAEEINFSLANQLIVLPASRIKVLNYDESSTAYLEFNEEEEVDYLIQALNKTAFDNRIINLDKLLD